MIMTGWHYGKGGKSEVRNQYSCDHCRGILNIIPQTVVLIKDKTFSQQRVGEENILGVLLFL